MPLVSTCPEGGDHGGGMWEVLFNPGPEMPLPQREGHTAASRQGGNRWHWALALGQESQVAQWHWFKEHHPALKRSSWDPVLRQTLVIQDQAATPSPGWALASQAGEGAWAEGGREPAFMGLALNKAHRAFTAESPATGL